MKLHEVVLPGRSVADLKLRYTGGDFYCANDMLTSLVGAPTSVGGAFHCGGNKLTSLRSIHRTIKQINGEFDCSDNEISDGLEYILLIKGVTRVLTDNNFFDQVVNAYLNNHSSGSIKAVFDVQELIK